MSDRDWRSAERQWQANPGDQDALQRAISARRRARVPVPGWMLDRRVFPGKRFASQRGATVMVLQPDGRPREVGRTPGALELPEHRAWWVQPDVPTDAEVAALADELCQQEAPGLSLRPDLTDAGLAHLGEVPNLHRLDLGGCFGISDAGLGHIGGLGALTWLSLWYCNQLTDAGLERLGDLTNLIHLELGGCTQLTDAGLAALEPLRELYVLSCHGCTLLGADGLEHLRGLERLTFLDLRKCARLTDEALDHVATLEELTILNLSFCTELTPAGLETLAPLQNLAQLLLVGCGKASERAEKVLGELLPRCEIVT